MAIIGGGHKPEMAPDYPAMLKKGIIYARKFAQIQRSAHIAHLLNANLPITPDHHFLKLTTEQLDAGFSQVEREASLNAGQRPRWNAEISVHALYKKVCRDREE